MSRPGVTVASVLDGAVVEPDGVVVVVVVVLEGDVVALVEPVVPVVLLVLPLVLDPVVPVVPDGDVVVLGVPGDVVDVLVSVDVVPLELGAVLVPEDGDVVDDWSVVVVLVLPDVCANAKPMAAAAAAIPAAMLRLFGNLLMKRFSCCINDKSQSAKLSPPRYRASSARPGVGTPHWQPPCAVAQPGCNIRRISMLVRRWCAVAT